MTYDLAVIACGGRDFMHGPTVYEALDRLKALYGSMLLIQGEARGADELAKLWAIDHGVPHEDFPARWDLHGRRAGFERNRTMLAHLLAVSAARRGVVAFPGGAGTQMMVDLARGANVPVWRP